MIQSFGVNGQRLAIDVSSIRGIAEQAKVQLVFVAGEREPFPVEAAFDELVAAWREGTRA